MDNYNIQKYFKYKNKYMLLKNIIGGQYEGQGSSGLVVSRPRIPFFDETYESIKTLPQVSKLYINNSMAQKDWDSCLELITKFPSIITSEYFILPLRLNKINKDIFKTKIDIYNKQWLNNKEEAILFFRKVMENEEVYQIIYNKGESVNRFINNVDQTDLNGNTFLNAMKYPIIAIKNTIDINLYFTDIKIGNMVYEDEKIKIIDFADKYYFKDTLYNIMIENIKKSNTLMNIYYINNNILCSSLLKIYAFNIRLDTDNYLKHELDDDNASYKYNKIGKNHLMYVKNIYNIYKEKNFISEITIKFKSIERRKKTKKRPFIGKTEEFSGEILKKRIDKDEQFKETLISESESEIESEIDKSKKTMISEIESEIESEIGESKKTMISEIGESKKTMISEIGEDEGEDEYEDVESKKTMISEIGESKKTMIGEIGEDEGEDEYEDVEVEKEFNFNDMIETILIFYNITDPRKINNIFSQYRNIIEKNNKEQIIYNLLKINNMYSLGFIFIQYINFRLHYKNFENIDNKILTKIMTIIMICCGQIIYKDNNVYTLSSTLDDVIYLIDNECV